MWVSSIQNCCYKMKKSKILLCCLTWHSHCFKNSHRYEACCSSDWYVYICLFADCKGQSIETHWICYWSWDTSSCRCWSYGAASVQMRTQRGAGRKWATDLLDKVTRWVFCLPDNTMARSEEPVNLLPWQLSSNSRLIRIKQGKSVFCAYNVRMFLCNKNQWNAHFSSKYFKPIFQFLTSSACFEPLGFILSMVWNM